MLARGVTKVLDDTVIAARGPVVGTADGTMTLRSRRAEEQPLAIPAPAPTMLPRSIGNTLYNHIPATAVNGVHTIGRARTQDRAVPVGNEMHALAFRTPPPVLLAWGSPAS